LEPETVAKTKAELPKDENRNRNQKSKNRHFGSVWLGSVWFLVLGEKVPRLIGRDKPVAIAEPPKLYDPHAPVIILKTSDDCACAPDNLRRSVECPQGTPIQLHLTTHTRINKGVTTTLQHLLQNFTSECERITTIDLQILIKLTFYKLNLNDGSRVELQKTTQAEHLS
jgi:hypothetical protein